jgi:hypothetical protein
MGARWRRQRPRQPDSAVRVLPRPPYKGHIPASAIQVWKALLVSLNSSQSDAVDVLLRLDRLQADSLGKYAVYSAGDLLHVAPRINAGLLAAVGVQAARSGSLSRPSFAIFRLELTDKGRLFTEAWKNGSPDALAAAIGDSESFTLTERAETRPSRYQPIIAAPLPRAAPAPAQESGPAREPPFAPPRCRTSPPTPPARSRRFLPTVRARPDDGCPAPCSA